MKPWMVTLALFATMALFGPKWLGPELDGWVLLAAGLIHLAIVIRTSVKVTGRTLFWHYIALSFSIAGCFWLISDQIGSTPSLTKMASLAVSQLSSRAGILFFLRYVFGVGIAMTCVSGAMFWAFHRQVPGVHEVTRNLLWSTLAWIPCDFALFDVWVTMGMENPLQMKSLASSLALSNLFYPLSLHLGFLLVYGLVWRRRSCL